MGILRIPLSGDCFITQEFKYGNSGRDPVLNVGIKYSGTSSNRYIERILGIFDVSSNSDLLTKINNGFIPNPTSDSSVTANLRMFNTLHGQRLARSFDLHIFPVINAWDEGGGIGFSDENLLYATGYANYVSRKAGSDWTTSGGDFLIDSNSATQTFDTGDEDLNVDITKMLRNWLSGVSANYGFIIKMPASYESSTGSLSASYDLWRKSFFARETNLLKWPKIEFVWDDNIKDYRNIFKAGDSGYLYFYNVINSRLNDLSGTAVFPGYVALEGLTSNSSTAWVSLSSSLSSLSAARVKQGIYRILINNFPYSLYNDYTTFRDKWVITSSISAAISSATAMFKVISPFNSSDYNFINFSRYSVFVRNMQQVFQKGNIITLRLFIKDLYENVLVLTASSTAFTSEVSDDGYYRVLTDKNEVDIDWQQLNFDKNGNFFTLDTNNFTRNFNYKIDFKLNIKGQEIIIDGNDIPTKFRVI